MPSFKLKSINHFGTMEMFAILIFIVFILFPIHLPAWASNNVVSYLVHLVILAFLFIKTNPILGVLYIFVIYEIFRRNASPLPANTNSAKFSETMVSESLPVIRTPIEQPTLLASGNEKHESTLEEEMVGKMAPVGKSSEMTHAETTYLPVNSKVDGASMYV